MDLRHPHNTLQNPSKVITLQLKFTFLTSCLKHKLVPCLGYKQHPQLVLTTKQG
jgi:hypothetical protein